MKSKLFKSNIQRTAIIKTHWPMPPKAPLGVEKFGHVGHQMTHLTCRQAAEAFAKSYNQFTKNKLSMLLRKEIL